EVEPDTFEHDVMQRLITFAKAQKDMPVPVEPLPSEQELLQKAADQVAGFTRLQQYANMDEGLEPVPENASLVDLWISENKKGYFSAANVDLAVQALRDILTWKQAAPPETEPKEVLQDWQLPLDATEAQMKKADVRALKDLISSRSVATNQVYVRKGHGSLF